MSVALCLVQVCEWIYDTKYQNEALAHRITGCPVNKYHSSNISAYVKLAERSVQVVVYMKIIYE